MKASEHIEALKELIEKYGDLELIYSHDDEGNNFQKVFYSPSVGMCEGDYYVKFYTKEDTEYLNKPYKPNCICIN